MTGRLLIIAGVGLVLLGLVFPLLGHLPGDVRFMRGGVRVYMPLGSCLLISVLISALLTAVMWFWRS
ncbi:MAG TPA: DUF2905 domain-containing protein [Acetobacteraceae bacterium]|jgi:hypothetical protein|nr:DUF2905 domain-containing protein [Acetobacteraceae bacterium]